jgi:sensor histidine kinase YesM
VVFRLIAPPIFGLVIYLLILMFFDSIGMLAENFFSREVLFVVGLTYLFFEINRLVIILFNGLFTDESNLRIRIILQYAVSIILTTATISSVLYSYFTYVEGFSTIRTELITFNAIFLMVAAFYHLFFFSLVYLSRKNEALVEKEKNLRHNLEFELRNFKYQINPALLFQSLEIIISELYRDKKSADDLINNLSKIYRNTLDNKHNDLVSLASEIESIHPFARIMKAKYKDSFKLDLNVDKEALEKNLVPGSLNLLMEKAFSENIISSTLPLIVSINSEKNALGFSYRKHERITTSHTGSDRLKYIAKAYSYYSDIGIREATEKGNHKIILPLMEIEEEI